VGRQLGAGGVAGAGPGTVRPLARAGDNANHGAHFQQWNSPCDSRRVRGARLSCLCQHVRRQRHHGRLTSGTYYRG